MIPILCMAGLVFRKLIDELFNTMCGVEDVLSGRSERFVAGLGLRSRDANKPGERRVAVAISRDR